MKRLKYFIALLALLMGLSFTLTTAHVGAASSAFDAACSGVNATSAICIDKKDADKKATKFIKTLVNTLLYILGTVSVVVIIFAGIFYTTSAGDPAGVTKAKNTLMYAVVGLVVALMAYAIVNFVIDKL